MAEKILDSTRAGMTRSSSHLITSIYGNDSLELVWENGKIHMQGGSSSSVTRKTPSCNGYNSMNRSLGEEADNEDACIAKNATLSLSTLYSLLDFPVQRDSDLYKSCCKLKVGSANLKESKGSHGLTGIQGQKPFISDASNPTSFVPRSQEPPPDEHSEAVSHNSAHSIHRSHAGLGSKRKAHTNYCDEPLLESSSIYSLGASSNTNLSSRKHDDTDDSIYLSDDYNDEEPEDVAKESKHAREGHRVKRSRKVENHNLHERKRRDKINKKMRILKELIPNCNKMDKASMLDDAIEYLKTLKLQVKIMSMGAGLCMPLTMLHSTAPHHMMNTHHLPQLMGAGMGFRPDTGFFPCSIPQFPITDYRVRMFGFPNQVPPIPISHAPCNSFLWSEILLHSHLKQYYNG